MTRVAFLVEEAGRSGGMAIILRYARALRAEPGLDAALVVTGSQPVDEARALSGFDGPVLDLAAARAERWDAVVVTWWTTAVPAAALAARRRIVLLQSIESRFYRQHELPEQAGAAVVPSLPADFVVISDFLRRTVAAVAPEARVALIPNGIDKRVFAPPAGRARGAGEPLRILVEGQPTLWFKDVGGAVRAARAAHEPVRLTAVMHDAAGSDAAALGVDEVVAGVGPHEMADLYARHDVLLKLSRVEGGTPLPVLEAAHVGVPTIATPFTGHDEFLRHEENALIVGFDDEEGTAAAVDRLARDSDLLARLGRGARAAGERWPHSDASAEAFTAAVRRWLDEPPPAAGQALERLQLSQGLWRDLVTERLRQERVHAAHLEGAVEWHRKAYEQAVDELVRERDRLQTALDEVNELYAQANSDLDALRSERAYRAAVRLRKVLRR